MAGLGGKAPEPGEKLKAALKVGKGTESSGKYHEGQAVTVDGKPGVVHSAVGKGV